MPQIDALVSPARSSSPLKASWFEFLLNPALLERHLSNNLDPSPSELIIQFLHNAAGSAVCPQSDLFNANGNSSQSIPFDLMQSHAATLPVNDLNSEISQQSFGGGIKTETEAIASETNTRKSQALKLLALQVAAYLEWNLNEFENKLPLPMQETLLTDLLKTVSGNNINAHVNVEWKEAKDMSSDVIFALFLYHRWVLRTVVAESFPSRGQRGLNVQIPGQVDPCCVPTDVQEHLIKRLQDGTQHSATFLLNLISDYKDHRMPIFKCIVAMTEEVPVPVHKWEDGIMLNCSDVVCQAAYDLGCFYFYQCDYPKAKELFSKTNDLHLTLETNLICKINKKRLEGYVQALTESRGMNTIPGQRTEDYDIVVNQLMEENFKKAAPISFREEFEMDVLQNCGESSFLYFKVAVCNAIHKTLEGNVLANNLSGILHHLDETKANFLLEVLKSAVSKATPLQMTFLKNMISTICFTLPAVAPKLLSVDALKPLMLDTMTLLKSHESQFGTTENIHVPDKPFTNDPAMRIKQLEKELLVARDLRHIDAVIHQLRSSGSRRPLWNITNKWELPKMFTSHLKSLPPGLDQDYFYVLLAKATELRNIQCYSEACQLYLKVQKETAEMLPLLGRVISWELLYTDLLQGASIPFPNHMDYQQRKMLQEAKNCVSIFIQERDYSPRVEIIELCLALLLNLREWEFLADLEQRNEGSIEFSSILASVCRDAETRMNKSTRTASKELWDAVLPLFSASTFQYKRTNSGMSREIQRESVYSLFPNRMDFIEFVKKLKHTVTLGILISCLTKIFNILKDDSSNDIFLEYSNLWPAVISNSGAISLSHVTDTLQSVLHHSLTVHPNHVSWLKIHGDFLFVETHYAAAMKQYLSAAMVCSDYFSQPVPRNFFDDLVYRRMIHCCTKLQCHTQAAVLSQFLEEPNYVAAFKSLGERVCNDSCDSYYAHIWDVTLLEFLVNLHSRRGEVDRKQLAVQTLGQLELNSNNNSEIQREAANLRRGRFLRALSKQYL